MLPADLLRRIAAQDVPGMKPTDYDLPTSLKLNEVISQAWTRALAHWTDFQAAREALREDDETGTVATRQQWLMPLLEILGFGKLTQQRAPEIEGKTYPIQFFWQHVPLHLLGCKLPIDRRSKGVTGAASSSPHSLVQEFLNRSDDHLWAVLTNGLQWRVLRDSVSLSRQAFVEFDLESMMDGEVYSDFVMLWLLCHVTRFEAEKPEQCLLETWSHLAVEEGTRILGGLRNGVTEAIQQLGEGLVGHPRNDSLRDLLRSGELDKQQLYREILRIVYRLLFLFVAEDRGLLHSPDASDEAKDAYRHYYSTTRLRDLADRIRGTGHGDLWQALSFIFARLDNTYGCTTLGLPGLGSFLWAAGSTPHLLGIPQSLPENVEYPCRVEIDNEHLLAAVRALAFAEVDGIRRVVDYRNLGAEELGSVYESLLELVPDVIATQTAETSRFELRTAAGNERKTSGSYYTPDSLVQCLLDSALEPVVADRIMDRKTSDEKAEAILSITVCDPAVGSGHFLLAAAHRLARHVARWRTGDLEPAPEDYQSALRDVIRRCVYGVDLNPMAAELCRVSLWIESMDPGKPLSFLDHHIQVGNSLLGTTPALLKNGIPQDAFKPIEGDISAVASELKKQNKQERRDREHGQGYLFEPHIGLGSVPSEFARLSSTRDDSVADVVEKERCYANLFSGADYQNARLLADTWCSAFVWQKDTSDLGKLCPTERLFREIESNPLSILPQVQSEVRRLAEQHQFFHWHLAFPDVFRLIDVEQGLEGAETGWSGGFDVVLGNPPWEASDLVEKEFFAVSAPDIAAARTKARRRALIDDLKNTNLVLAKEWYEQCRSNHANSHFIKDSGLFPLGSGGKLNTYRIFSELSTILIKPQGRMGMVLKSGIVNAQDSQLYFSTLLRKKRICGVIEFINTKQIFLDVVANERFCLFTVAGINGVDTPAQYMFGLTAVSEIQASDKGFFISVDELHTINPNDLSVPPLNSPRDKALLVAIHSLQRPVRIDDEEDGNPWHLKYAQGHLNSASGSSLFAEYTLEQLMESGAEWVEQTELQIDSLRFIPLYEGKFIAQMQHRFGTFEGVAVSRRFGVKAEAQSPSIAQLNDPCYEIMPRYWLPSIEADKLYEKKKTTNSWLFSFRDVCRAIVDARTVQACALPRRPCLDGCPLLVFDLDQDRDAQATLFFSSVWASFVLDYSARQKIHGAHLTKAIAYQLPTPRPEALYQRFISGTLWDFVFPRALELTYVTFSLSSLASSVGYSGSPFRWDEQRRFQLRSELDAAYFHLYLGAPTEWGTGSPELRGMFPTSRDAVEYIMETFPIVKRKDIKRTEEVGESGEVTIEGSYITKDTILSIYDEMAECIASGSPWESPLDPPPADPRAAHSAEGAETLQQSVGKLPT